MFGHCTLFNNARPARHFLVPMIILAPVFATMPPNALGEGLHAYYTRVQHSASDYVGKYPDIIVVLGEGRRLEFTRQTGYLPRWRTPSSEALVDDFFPSRKEDFSFDYNYVRLIKNSPEEVVVHWRYIPDVQPLASANARLDALVPEGFTGVVHETFTIRPDGTVEREVREARGTRYRDWAHPKARTRQTITLSDDGVDHGPVDWGNMGPFAWEQSPGTPIKSPRGGPRPVQAWRFDEGLEEQEEPGEGVDLVFDDIDEMEGIVEGLMTVYKRGVSGTALAFDGYYNRVTPLDSPHLEEEMTLEAWVALDVLPYNTAPIVHQSTGLGEEGYYLGVDAYGRPLCTLGGVTVVGPDSLRLHRWEHVAATADGDDLRLYVNGEQVGAEDLDDELDPPDVPMVIGRNTKKSRCTAFVRGDDQNLPMLMGIQGLIDELRIYDTALNDDQVAAQYRALEPDDAGSDLATAVLPGELGVADAFGAKYKTLQFHELWDKRWRSSDHADIVVKFDNIPCSVVYWRGTNGAANWVTDNNRWMADQSSEIFTKHGCSEHMADKQGRHSYARVIENTPARVVVHWRYPCVDVSYLCTNRRHWSDEYHTIYPDGTGVRKVFWNKGSDAPGFQDIQFLTNPGETALDVMHLQAATVANLDGDIHELTWRKPNHIPRNPLARDGAVAVFNSKSDYKVFAVYPGGSVSPWGAQEQSQHTEDPFAGPWNHWPVHLVPSDGRFAVAPDRVTHFAIGASGASEHGGVMMYGFTKQPIDTLLPMARAWRNPPEVSGVSGAESHGFDTEERAFVFESTGGDIVFEVQASEESPLVNPCLVLRGWDSDSPVRVRIDAQDMEPGGDFRQGTVYDVEGRPTRVLWLRHAHEAPCKVMITAN